MSSGCSPKQNSADGNQGARDGELYARDDLTCGESRSGKMWQREKGGMFSSRQDAEQYVANLQIGGFDDWRLPTREELFTLHNALYWKKNGDCVLDNHGEFWTASKDGEHSPGHWETYFL